MGITVERASELVKGLHNQHDRYDLFDHFYRHFDPSYSRDFGAFFAELCGFSVATNVTLIKSKNNG